jgi:GntR family transcriptional regulator
MIEQVGKPHSQRPLYEQVKAVVGAYSGWHLSAFGTAPFEHELSEQFGVSRITVRQALHKLSQRA